MAQPGQNTIDAGRTLIWDPETNNAKSVPNTDVPDLLQKGAKLAVPIRDKATGSLRLVPHDKVAAFQAQGHKVDLDSIDQTHKEGAVSSFFSTVGNFVKGMTTPSGMAPGGYPTVQYEPKTIGVKDSRGKVHDVTNPARKPGERFSDLGENDPKQASAIAAVKRDTARKENGYGLAYRTVAPVGEALGVDVGGMEHAANEGDFAGVLGHAAGSGASLAAMEMAPRVLGKASEKVGSVLKNTANDVYRSDLKMGPATSIKDANATAQTGLNNKIPISEQGVGKIYDLVQQFHKDYLSKIDPNATVDPNKVAERVDQVKGKFEEQVNPKDDEAALDASKKEYLEKHGQKSGEAPSNQAGFTGGKTAGTPAQSAKPYSALEAQAEKTGTYRQLADKAYKGEILKGASVEGQKALARGIKEEIVNQFPELAELGKKEGALLDLEPIIEKAVRKQQNSPAVSAKDIVAGVAGEAMSGSMGVGTAAAVVSKIIRSPMLRSKIAIALNEAGKGLSMADAYKRYDGWLADADQKLKEKAASFNKNEKGTFGDQGDETPQKAVPDWPSNYKSADKSKGGGANYTADELAAFKKKHGIADDSALAADLNNLLQKKD